MPTCFRAAVWLVASGFAAVGAVSRADDAQPIVFEKDVLPILTAHCFKCHGLEARKASLDLRTVGLMLRGGDNGPVIVKGSAKESPLFERISDRSMPPEKELPLTDAKIELIGRWLDAGAPSDAPESPLAEGEAPAVTAENRQFWAFRAPERPDVPSVRESASARTAIDAFVLTRLEEKSLSFSPEADRHELARRVSFDLLGLPPAPEVVDAFAADGGESAYEQLIDRLLASPHFGERFGRHWLDASGYVDTIGDDTDAAITKVANGKWLYRDYVVRSFNDDKPLDRFLTEQLAGDELVDWQSSDVLSADTKQLLVATGMLRAAADETMQNELNTADIRQAVLEHTMEVVTNNLLGLTVHCARCHTHKFDPIPQEDYYRLLAIFSPAFNPQSWLQPPQRELPDISKSEKAKADAHNVDLDKQIGQCKERLSALKKPCEERLFDGKLATIPEPIRADTKEAIRTPKDKRNEVQKYLVDKFETLLKVSNDEVVAALSPADKQAADALGAQINRLNATRTTWGTIQAVYDVGPPPATYLLRRGNLDRPGPEVPAGFLRVLCESEATSRVDANAPNQHASGRRLALARWLTAPGTPAAGLVARVYVNRVWQYLFGQGIVTTSDNFGHSGARPSHPELLDWLAVEFQSSGWRVKPLVKRIVMSRAYRQSSHPRDDARTAAALAVDPTDELLWRMRLRQIESECVRDAVLSAAGELEPSIGGPPTPIEGKSDGTVVVKKEGTTEGQRQRRSMYLMARRRYNVSLLEAFDQPEMTSNCTRRSPSAVVAQSLTMLNDEFVIEQSQRFAVRVMREAAEPAQRIGRAFLIALARPPSEEEATWAADLLRKQTERYASQSTPPDEVALKVLGHLCQMLLNTNEFLYLQ